MPAADTPRIKNEPHQTEFILRTTGNLRRKRVPPPRVKTENLGRAGTVNLVSPVMANGMLLLEEPRPSRVKRRREVVELDDTEEGTSPTRDPDARRVLRIKKE